MPGEPHCGPYSLHWCQSSSSHRHLEPLPTRAQGSVPSLQYSFLYRLNYISISPVLCFCFYKNTYTFQAGSLEPQASPNDSGKDFPCQPLPGCCCHSSHTGVSMAPRTHPGASREADPGAPRSAFLTSVSVPVGTTLRTTAPGQSSTCCQSHTHILSSLLPREGVSSGATLRNPKISMQKGKPTLGQRTVWAGAGQAPRPSCCYRPPRREVSGRQEPPHRILRPLLGVRVPPRGRRGDPRHVIERSML